MSDSDPLSPAGQSASVPPPQRQRLHDAPDPPNDLDEPEDPFVAEEEHGRIGYGRLGEWTPYALALAILLTIVVIATIKWVQNDDGDDTPAGQPTTEPVARGAAPSFTTTLLDGAAFDLAAQRGKVVVVNFWATWCEPCQAEMPALQQLASANPDDVVVIGLAAPTDSTTGAADFARQYGISYPLAIDTGGNGPVGGIAGNYQVFGYPATFFINAEGNIVDAVFGSWPADQLQGYVDRARATTAG